MIRNGIALIDDQQTTKDSPPVGRYSAPLDYYDFDDRLIYTIVPQYQLP
jgi:hypothetical protein